MGTETVPSGPDSWSAHDSWGPGSLYQKGLLLGHVTWGLSLSLCPLSGDGAVCSRNLTAPGLSSSWACGTVQANGVARPGWDEPPPTSRRPDRGYWWGPSFSFISSPSVTTGRCSGQGEESSLGPQV